MRHRVVPATREPDRYGIAVGDLIAGTDVTRQSSHVGVVTEIIPYRPYVGMSGNRYHVRCGELYSTGEVIERVMHDHPLVIVPAGNPVVCATCSGEHAGADRFIECLVAHLRASRTAPGWPGNGCPRVGCVDFWSGVPHEHGEAVSA